MGSIAIKFEGLCVFFQDKMNAQKPSLTVGMVKVDGKENCCSHSNYPWCNVDPQDVHIPIISIFKIDWSLKKKIPIPNFQSRALSGDILFHSWNPTAPAIKNFTPETNLPLVKKIHNAQGTEAWPEEFPHEPNTIAVQFNAVKAGKLYEGSAPRPSRQKCAARLHFNTGVLFAPKKEDPFKFATLKPNSISGVVDTNSFEASQGVEPKLLQWAGSAGLEIPLGRTGLSLFFSDCTSGFYFSPIHDYVINVTNESVNSPEKNHFLYYYSVFNPTPSEFWSPVKQSGGVPSNGEPWCSPMGAP